MKYTTPKGNKYWVGMKFDAMNKGNTHYISKLKTGVIWIKRVGNKSDTEGRHMLAWFTGLIDSGEYKILVNQGQDYQTVDPSTIKFNFTNTKIRVNSPEESEWIQKVAFNNNKSWHNENWEKTYEVQFTFAEFLYFGIPYIEYGTAATWFVRHNSRQITIQDILNNQMKHKFKVGDILISNSANKNTTLVVKEINEKGQYLTHYLGHDNTLKDSQEWIESNYNLDINQMEHVNPCIEINMKELIEVGDIVEHISTGKTYIVRALTCDRIVTDGNDFFYKYNEDKLKIVSKANKQEIVGYELLKDLPGIPAGTKTVELKASGFATFGNDLGVFSNKQLQDTTWFKPIYKAKEVVVNISNNREVTIKDNKVSIEDGVEFCSFSQMTNMYQALQHKGHILTGRRSYEFEATSYKIGCQEFTKEDIEAVYKAIQNFK